MRNPFDDFPKYEQWFFSKKALAWREDHEAGILEAMEAMDRLKNLKERWVEHRGCSSDCESCDTADWCLFTIQGEELTE